MVFKAFPGAVALTFCGLLSTATHAATFSVLEEGTTMLLGTFEAPEAGGAITSGTFSVDGGIFDTLGAPPTDPVFDAGNAWIVGGGSAFGSFVNAAAYNTVDTNSNPISCGIGECVLNFTSGGGNAAPEWSLNYFPADPSDAAIIDIGFYEITPAPIPLPAAAWLLLAGLGCLGVIRRLG